MKIIQSTAFKRDIKRLHKSGYNMELIKAVIKTLAVPEKLAEKYKDHALTGDKKLYRDCHILPDWLLLYRYNGDALELYRTGTHSEIFK